MDTGVAIFPTHDALDPGAVARLAEDRGHESLFFAEHTHIPADRLTPAPNGADLPRRYWHTYDLFVAMTAAVSSTRRLRVGSGICLVIEHDPIITAKAVASIDALSGGRVLDELERAGVRRAVHWLPAAGLGPVERALARFEAAVAELHGE